MSKADIHVVSHKNGWATKKERAQRAGVVIDAPKAAIEQARDQVRCDQIEILIHRKDGTICDSYGNYPNPPKDKKH